MRSTISYDVGRKMGWDLNRWEYQGAKLSKPGVDGVDIVDIKIGYTNLWRIKSQMIKDWAEQNKSVKKIKGRLYYIIPLKWLNENDLTNGK
jgi:hypothetical protein